MTRKLLLPILTLILLVSCAQGKTGGDEFSFTATILEINGSVILAEPIAGDDTLRSSDRIMFSSTELDEIGAGVGDVVSVIYKGGISETYPAQVTAVSWAMIEKFVVPEVLVNVDMETVTWNEKLAVMQTALFDLDGDGADEQITVYFTSEYFNEDFPSYDTCEIEITSTTGTHSFAYKETNIRPQLLFAYFDMQNGRTHFYVESDGPSGDPYTQVFSFNGTQIVKNTGFPGFVTGYDGNGRIYSFDIYSVNCYYDVNNGLTPLPKENIIGNEIQRDFNILLVESPGNDFTAAILSSYYEENLEEYTRHFKDGFISFVPANTPLTVLDIEFLNYPWSDTEELYYVPWIKVKTPDGIEGWFGVAYGD